MSIEQIVVLAIVQGITEFLPISSSAHLLIPSPAIPSSLSLVLCDHFPRPIRDVHANCNAKFTEYSKASQWCVTTAHTSMVMTSSNESMSKLSRSLKIEKHTAFRQLPCKCVMYVLYYVYIHALGVGKYIVSRYVHSTPYFTILQVRYKHRHSTVIKARAH